MMQQLPKILFVMSLLVASFFWGLSTHIFKVFPYNFLMESAIGLVHAGYNTPWLSQWYYQDSTQEQHLAVSNPTRAQKGLNKLVVVDKDKQLAVKVVDVNAQLVHQWKIDWFTLWPDATHLHDIEKPKSRPGTHIHGAEILANGDLLFNFEHLGLMRIDACGNPVWRLPYQTHHSIYQDTDGSFWVAAQKNHYKTRKEYPNFKGPYYVEPMVIQVSPEGKVLQEFSLFDVLQRNHLEGLLYLSTIDNLDVSSTGDFLHLNDVEVFPEYMLEDFFNHGDILLSLRNINTVMVLESETLKVKYLSTGKYLRQHDPDFIDGNRFSVYDNNNQGKPGKTQRSKIIIENARTNTLEVVFEGSEQQPFYSQIMGKHQWLANGNLFISESMRGRAFEITPQNEVVWDYYNLIEKGKVGLLEEAERLPSQFTREFFEKARSNCNLNV